METRPSSGVKRPASTRATRGVLATRDYASRSEDYILGTDIEELRRLEFQHLVWAGDAHAIWQRSGFRGGHTILDLGSGPGFSSVDLARLVGRSGRIIARDRCASFLAFLRSERERVSLPQIETDLGPVEELDLAPHELDGVYARWLFCWLPDPAEVLSRVARSLKPGGVLAAQEYLDWRTLKLVPGSAVVDQVVDACMESFRAGGGRIDVGGELPQYARRCGLRVESVRPIARFSPVGSPCWSWLSGFFASYLPRLVERGQLAADVESAFFEEWHHHADAGKSFVQTPTMVDVILRKA